MKHVSESLTPAIRLFGRDWIANCEPVRVGGEQAKTELPVRNEGEPHPMSPEIASLCSRATVVMAKADMFGQEETR